MHLSRVFRPAKSSVLLVVATFLFGATSAVSAATATLRPSKDTTIYGSGDAELSNGAGAFLFAGSSGSNGGGRPLRSLVAFNLAGQVPAGSTINAVTLTLAINTPMASFANTVQLHRITADWGEGTSNPASGGAAGAAATSGDATWKARFFGTSNWTTPGGDFLPAVSASQRVAGSSGTATFSGAGLVADVQAWVNNAGSNFGWILVAQDESGAAVRFASKEGSTAPTLTIDFTAGSGNTTAAPVFTTQPASQTATAGATVTFSAAASGTPTPSFAWQKNGAAISGATGATLTLTNVSASDAGSYTVVASNSVGALPSNAATLTVNAAPPPPPAGGSTTARLSNLSVRTTMGAGQTLIVGVVIGGGGSRDVLVRAAGPALAGFGLSSAMADPKLQLFNGTSLAFENDNWTASLAATFASVGAFPFTAGSRDAAFVQGVDGARSIQATGTGAGVVLVEAYDTGGTDSARLVNVSARNRVGTGDDILIAGFNVAGTGGKRLLIRAVGPKLGGFGVSGFLVDPKLEVFSGTTKLTENDNWDASLAATFSAVGAFGLDANSRDAALLTTIQPGSYTVQVSGVNNGTGEALIEIYEVP